jgi:hypothetical protein
MRREATLLSLSLQGIGTARGGTPSMGAASGGTKRCPIPICRGCRCGRERANEGPISGDAAGRFGDSMATGGMAIGEPMGVWGSTAAAMDASKSLCESPCVRAFNLLTRWLYEVSGLRSGVLWRANEAGSKTLYLFEVVRGIWRGGYCRL